MFQTEYYRRDETILDPGDISRINKQAVKFINLMLFQSLLFKRDDWIKQALDFRKRVETNTPGFYGTGTSAMVTSDVGLDASQRRRSSVRHVVCADSAWHATTA